MLLLPHKNWCGANTFFVPKKQPGSVIFELFRRKNSISSIKINTTNKKYDQIYTGKRSIGHQK